jgi:SRSO17 transposase
VPNEVGFRTKWQIALEQIDAALAAGLRNHVVFTDAGYGDVPAFRAALTERGLPYVVGVNGQEIVWPPGSRPRVHPQSPGIRGKRPTRHRDDKHPPVAIVTLATRLRYRQVNWREGSRGWQSSRFAAARVRTAARHYHGRPPGEEQWLLCQWPDGEERPTKYWLTSLAPDVSLTSLVRAAKLRWRVERDYQDLKEEVGLDHFEGRSWRGFHHHTTLCAVAHAFLALRRALFPPEATEMDASDGAQVPPAGATSARRLLPALPATRRRTSSAARAVADVIE